MSLSLKNQAFGIMPDNLNFLKEQFESVSFRLSDAGLDQALLFPSLPITSASARTNRSSKRELAIYCEDMEAACRSFENYLVKMIVEEGKVRDLADVEELLYCCKNLKCPVFIDLVCRFYGELCKDLFSTGEDDDDNYSTPR
ncbi:transcription repressor OFP17 [Malania oleifera]|uniref:transcription repressor OFP17 n=1 Tax=Malania oleifera TaxID=397392 RepID=UPI0025AE1D18|nr:transcription repressor OFP17 [Malania oleifera]